jgi:N-acetylglucosaminyldiphosphoundecaprenol N-acetyl-beta-D-mannosaminyltransferase
MQNISEGSLPVFELLNFKVHAVQYLQVLEQMKSWIKAHDAGHFIVVANTYNLMEGRLDPFLSQAMQDADMVIPDGMPLVVVGRMRGFHLPRRADGPGLVAETLEQSGKLGWRHFFYGGTPEVLAKLLSKVQSSWPEVNVVGSYAPPFRPLCQKEDQAVVEMINAAHPDVVWVGLGCPKQERWMLEHYQYLNAPVLLGVGQAFDLLAGVKKRAPRWMCESGLEWLYRLTHEPRRTWRRYLRHNPNFLWLAFWEQLAWIRQQKVAK